MLNMMQPVTIVDYGMGNLNSVKNAFSHLGKETVVASSLEDLEKASAIILPGVGAFGKAMHNLKDLNVIPLLTEKVLNEKIPFLGICLGMQLVARSSEEDVGVEGLKWIDGRVRKIRVSASFRLPHIGWNDLEVKTGSLLFNGLGGDKNFYFVHSFQLECCEDIVEATTHYGERITASVRRDNIFATQFHPEKSHVNGMKVLKNFLSYVDGIGAGVC